MKLAATTGKRLTSADWLAVQIGVMIGGSWIFPLFKYTQRFGYPVMLMIGFWLTVLSMPLLLQMMLKKDAFEVHHTFPTRVFRSAILLLPMWIFTLGMLLVFFSANHFYLESLLDSRLREIR